MNAPSRQFSATDAVRSHVPLLIGLTGPSSSGKTFTALRLATGIREVSGGDIYFIDTESKRALHYADKFDFKHVPFEAPFGSLDYLEALKFCVGNGAGVVIVDSMSHEHEGPGGMVDLHDALVEKWCTRENGSYDFAKAERVKMLAWNEPKQNRRRLINGILQLNANFIFCFRAKNTSKPVKKDGKTEVEQMGFMPIAGEEFVFEMTINALFYPGARGVPTWEPEGIGEKVMVKMPDQFRKLLDYPDRSLDEGIGKWMAKWARGEDSSFQTKGQGAEQTAEPQTGEPSRSPQDDAEIPSQTKLDELLERAGKVNTIEALESLEAEAGIYTREMDDDSASRVDQALNLAARRIHAANKGDE